MLVGLNASSSVALSIFNDRAAKEGRPWKSTRACRVSRAPSCAARRLTFSRSSGSGYGVRLSLPFATARPTSGHPAPTPRLPRATVRCRGDPHPARRPLPTVANDCADPASASPSMRTASRSAMPWGAPRAPPVVRDPPPGARRRRSPPRLRLPIRARRPDQPGCDPVRRAIWPPDPLRPAFTRPSCPVDGRSAAHMARSGPLSGSQAAISDPSVLRSGRDRRTTGLHGPSCHSRTSLRAGLLRPAAGCADRSGTPGHAPGPPLSSRPPPTTRGPIAPFPRTPLLPPPVF